MLEFITVEHRFMGKDLFQQYTQFGNIPLSIAEIIGEISDCFLGRYFERLVETVVG